jgi:hypothetical protein
MLQEPCPLLVQRRKWLHICLFFYPSLRIQEVFEKKREAFRPYWKEKPQECDIV